MFMAYGRAATVSASLRDTSSVRMEPHTGSSYPRLRSAVRSTPRRGNEVIAVIAVIAVC